MKRIPITALLVLVAAATVGVSSGDGWIASEASAEAKRTTKLKLKHSPYGKVLFADGYAMYLFTEDRGWSSECQGACARAWPPLIKRGRIVVGGDVRKQLIGTSRRGDGSKQITYDGHPLYGYIDDPRGEVFCHDVFEFGGTWYAVKRSGRPAPSG